MYVFRIGVLITTVLFTVSGAIAGLTPEQKCQAGKNKAAGKFSACLANAEKFTISGDLEKYLPAIIKCGDKVLAAWNKLETKAADAGVSCPTTDDLVAISSFLQASEYGVAQALSGLPLPLDPLTCAAQLDTLNDEVATLSMEVADLTTAVGDLESQMRCPTTGLAGSYSISLPDFAQSCTGTLTQSGSSISFPMNCTFFGAISLTGSVSGSVVTLSELAAPACGNNDISVTLTIDNGCVTATGAFSCIAAAGSVFVQRL